MIQQRAIGLGCVVQPLQEVAELLGQELVESAQPLGTAGLSGPMSQAVPVALQPDTGRKRVGDRRRAGHLADHVRGQSRGVGLERQEQQVIHRPQVLARSILVDGQVE